MRFFTDFFKLFWPIRGGYRLFVPYVIGYSWPLLRWVAWIHRRTIMRRVRVVTVVGSVGKTTAKRMVDAALGDGVTKHSISNYGFGLAINVLRSLPRHHSTVLEVGIAGPGRMAGYAQMLRPDLVVVTSVKSDHNRSLPTLEDTRAEKVKMINSLGPKAVAVLNGDDPHVRWMASQTKARVVTFGYEAHNDIRASDAVLAWPDGTRFVLHVAGQTHRVQIRTLGAHQVYAALAAVAVGLAEGWDLRALIQRIEQVDPTPMRLKPVKLANGAVILSDELKGSIESTHAALDTLAQVPAKRRFAVLGPIHEQQGPDGEIYRSVGRRAARAADHIIYFGHTKQFTLLRAEAVRSGMKRESIVRIGNDVKEAVNLLQRQIQEGDVLLLKGASSLRLKRIRLALQGAPVRCRAISCKVRWHDCDNCPLREQPETALQNTYIKLLVKAPLAGDNGQPQRLSSRPEGEGACAAS